MKILIPSLACKRNHQGGFVAVIVMIILLGLILTFIVANVRVLATLHGDIKIVEKKQIQRLARDTTNAPPVSQSLTNTNSPAPATPPANQ